MQNIKQKLIKNFKQNCLLALTLFCKSFSKIFTQVTVSRRMLQSKWLKFGKQFQFIWCKKKYALSSGSNPFLSLTNYKYELHIRIQLSLSNYTVCIISISLFVARMVEWVESLFLSLTNYSYKLQLSLSNHHIASMLMPVKIPFVLWLKRFYYLIRLCGISMNC